MSKKPNPLKAWREAQGLTQVEAAERLSTKEAPVRQSELSLWERGKVKIPVTRVPKIAEVTGIPRIELRPDKPDLFG